MLPAGAAGDLETSRFLLSLQERDRHASGIVYFDQSTSASATAAAAVIEVKVEAFHESEEALQAEMGTICALRSSQCQYGIGVFVSGLRAILPPLMPTCRFPWRLLQAPVLGHEYSARDDITLKITVWLPRPRAAKAHVPQSQRVIDDTPPRASAFGGQLSMPLMNAPIEVDTVSLQFLLSCSNSRDHRGKGADQHAASLCAWEV